MFESIHEFCAEAVRMSGQYPEATVAAWGASAILMLVQVISLIKYLTLGNAKVEDEDDGDECEDTNVVTVPYVPNEMILKLLKLMEKQESGWKIQDNRDHNNCYTYTTLNYGNNLSISKKKGGTIEVATKGAVIPLAKNSKNPDFDQDLLLPAFNGRVRAERAKLTKAAEQYAAQAEDHANRELTNILSTI